VSTTHRPARLSLPHLTVAAALFTVGCGSDDGSERDTGTTTRDIGASDVGIRDTARGDTGSGGGDVITLDTSPPRDTSTPEETGDRDTDGPSECDRDGDGTDSIACGGDDCDDNNPRVHIAAREICDAVDNNCDGNVNEGITCEFYAHTQFDLYRVDPFAGTATLVTDVPGLFDFDTDTSGTLYGITSSQLYRFDEGTSSWDVVGSGLSLGFASINGFAVNSSGGAFATGGNDVYSIDLDAGPSERIGSMGGSYNSSGDCVVDKSDTLYMTSNHGFGGDTLVRINTLTGAATTIGPIGHSNIYGLTSAWGILFGLAENGDLIEIDIETGAGTRLHNFAGLAWYGAASTASR
jgi:hypothetical protein